jgi:predicted nucleic acid-binding protein
VPLIVDEPTTDAMRELLTQDSGILIWLCASVELLSMLGRLGRTASGIDDLVPVLRNDALRLVARANRVADVDAVRRRAERLVGVHPLSAADAMQLAAALVACSDRPEVLPFVTLDRQLARSAQLEGFTAIVP